MEFRPPQTHYLFRAGGVWGEAGGVEDKQESAQQTVDLVKAKGKKWELIVLEAEKVPKDEQLKIAARTTLHYHKYSYFRGAC
jgi:hypothetical protein